MTTKGRVCLSALSDPCFHFRRDTAVLSGYLGSSKSLKHKSSVYHSGNTHIIWNPAAVTAAARVRLPGDLGGLSLIQIYCWLSFYPCVTFQNITHLPRIVTIYRTGCGGTQATREDWEVAQEKQDRREDEKPKSEGTNAVLKTS